MNRTVLFGVVGLVLALALAVVGWATQGQGLAPEGALTIHGPEDVLMELGATYALERSEAGDFSVSVASVADRLLADMPTTLLDVRSPESFKELHLKGSLSLPLQRLLEVGAQLELPVGGLLVVVCDRGYTAVEGMVLLRLAGHPAYAMTGGVQGFREALQALEVSDASSPFMDPRFLGREPALIALLETGEGDLELRLPEGRPESPRARKAASMGEGC